HIDTSDITGLPILPLSVKEKVSDIYFRRDPQSEKQYVLGIKQDGIDDIGDLKSIQTIVEDVFREVDLYDDNITLLRNRFVSPLSPIAPDFYKFFLSDTVSIGATKYVVLSFAPRNPATYGFLGRIYVEDGDSTMFVRKVSMGVSPSINLNFIDRIRIEQEFDKAPDGSRLKTRDDLNVEMSIVKGTQSLYARRATAYNRHSFDIPGQAALFDRQENTITSTEAYARDSQFWNNERLVKASHNETRIDNLLSQLRSVPVYRYGERFLKLIVLGYVATGNPSKFDIGPLNTFISYNSIEGLRLRAGGITTANLISHLFARGYVAYGFRDRKWKYNGEIEYSFNRKEYHSREFPIHSLSVSERYDIDQLGQNYQFTNADNVFIALKRGDNHLITYKRHTGINYKLELPWNLSFDLSGAWERQEPGPYLPFTLVTGASLPHIDETLFRMTLRYAPGEKFYQTKSSRVPISKDAPVFILSHTYAPKGLFGSRYDINKTEFSARKRVWFSAFGYVDLMAKCGHVWSRTPYIWLLTPNANLSYTIQPESFALVNPLEFINDSFVSWEMTYWANGALFNYIPLIKKSRLREVISFKGWWGKLSSKNRPGAMPGQPQLLDLPEGTNIEMGNTPYMEISAGIDNIFRCLRLDYVWRLTYKNVAGTDRHGLRVAFHVTF
ncbi:MAG: carboxypeptidase-like regulatory domain-containing protein, partial [Muribaculaceae bacterium]|nr:carboxypeptidase-like regulatory domain-containing protein [Muribaculaceae bacterium]